MPWQWFRKDRAAVLEALRRGERPTAASTFALTELDELAYLASMLGVFDALHLLHPKRARSGVPDDLLLSTLTVLPFVAAWSLSEAAKTLFRDAPILLQIGYTALNLQNGFNKRYRNASGHKACSSLPVHPDVLRDELARLDPENLQQFSEQCTRRLYQRGLVRGHVYAVDATGLHDDWTLVLLMNVTRARGIAVGWRLLRFHASEKGAGGAITLPLVDSLLGCGASRGPGAIELLVADAEYADGPLLAQLKWGEGPLGRPRGIDTLVRLPEDREAYGDMQGQVRLALLEEAGRDGQAERLWTEHREVRYIAGQKQDRRVRAASFADLQTWDGFRNEARRLGVAEGKAKLWGALVEELSPKEQRLEEALGLIGTRSFPSAWAGYCVYRGRWEIENAGFRELKEGWHLEEAQWGRSEAVVAGRVAFTLVDFNVAQVYKGQQGKHLLEMGIRRLRQELQGRYGPTPVVIFIGRHYGILAVEELLEAVGRPAEDSLRPWGGRDGPPGLGPAESERAPPRRRQGCVEGHRDTQ